MRRILPVLVFLSVPLNSNAQVPWSYVEDSCGWSTGDKGAICKIGKSVYCGSETSGDCSYNRYSGLPNESDKAKKLAASVRICEQAAVDAISGCTTDRSGASLKGLDSGGDIKQICKDFETGADKAKNVNILVAGQCRGKIAICKVTCDSIKRDLAGAGYTPTEVGSTSIEKALSSCAGLKASAASSLEASVGTTADASAIAAYCGKQVEDKSPGGKDGPGGGGKDTPGGGGKTDATKNASNSNPMGGMNPMQLMSLAQQLMKQNEDPEDEMQEPEMQDCSSNPALAGCTVQTASVQSWNQPTGEAGTAKDSDEGSGTSNPADISGAQTASLGPQAGQVGTPPTYQGISNGGGQMLGGGGGGGPASLGGGGGGGGAAGGGKKVEITTGGGGGGFSQQAANMKMTNGEGGGGYNYGGRNPSGVDNGFNLSEFLPGGAKDPFKGRAIAGSMSGTNNFQIQSKEVNLFSRISERIKSRCAQGLLRDCIP